MPGSGLSAFNLTKRTHCQTLYIAKRFPGNYVEPPPGVELRIIPYWEPKVPEVLGVLSLIWVAFGKSLGSLWFLLRAAPTIARFKPDIVHIHTILPIVFAPFVKFVLRRPVVMTIHGTEFVRLRKSTLLRGLVDLSVDVVICVSHHMSNELGQQLRNTKVVTVPNGVDLEQFRNRGQLRKRQIIAVGHLKWQKGYEYLLEAMHQLMADDPEMRLLIAGSGPLETELRSYAMSLGLEKNVSFLGTIPHSEIADRLNESRVFVMASVTEGFPKALLEAMACGLPAVVTDVGECRAMVDGAGCVVPARSPDALAAGIRRLLYDEVEWQKSSERAFVNAQQYTWDDAARRVLPVYEELLLAKPMPGILS